MTALSFRQHTRSLDLFQDEANELFDRRGSSKSQTLLSAACAVAAFYDRTPSTSITVYVAASDKVAISAKRFCHHSAS